MEIIANPGGEKRWREEVEVEEEKSGMLSLSHGIGAREK